MNNTNPVQSFHEKFVTMNTPKTLSAFISAWFTSGSAQRRAEEGEWSLILPPIISEPRKQAKELWKKVRVDILAKNPNISNLEEKERERAIVALLFDMVQQQALPKHQPVTDDEYTELLLTEEAAIRDVIVNDIVWRSKDLSKEEFLQEFDKLVKQKESFLVGARSALKDVVAGLEELRKSTSVKTLSFK